MEKNSKVKELIDGLFRKKKKKAERIASVSKAAGNSSIMLKDMKMVGNYDGGANGIFSFGSSWKVEDSTALRTFSNNSRKIQYRSTEGTGNNIDTSLLNNPNLPHEYLRYPIDPRYSFLKVKDNEEITDESDQYHLIGHAFVIDLIRSIEHEMVSRIYPMGPYSYPQLRGIMAESAKYVIENTRKSLDDEIMQIMNAGYEANIDPSGISFSRISSLQTTQRLLLLMLYDIDDRAVSISRIFPIGMFPLADIFSVNPGSLPFTLMMSSPGLGPSLREYRKYIDEQLLYRIQNPLIHTSLKIDV